MARCACVFGVSGLMPVYPPQHERTTSMDNLPMRINGLPGLMRFLGFNPAHSPADAEDGVYLESFEYNFGEDYWLFGFDYPEIKLDVHAEDIPDDVWAAIEAHASPGSDVLIFLRISAGFAADADLTEIAGRLTEDLSEFRAEIARIEGLVEPWISR